jgi:hypothetical protein
MRELVGYLAARGGGEQTVARRAAGALQQFQCNQLWRKDRAYPAALDGESIGTDIALGKGPASASAITDDILTHRVRSGSPITVFYAGENFTGDAAAGAIPGFAYSIEISQRARPPARERGEGDAVPDQAA